MLDEMDWVRKEEPVVAIPLPSREPGVSQLQKAKLTGYKRDKSEKKDRQVGMTLLTRKRRYIKRKSHVYWT